MCAPFLPCRVLQGPRISKLLCRSLLRGATFLLSGLLGFFKNVSAASKSRGGVLAELHGVEGARGGRKGDGGGNAGADAHSATRDGRRNLL